MARAVSKVWWRRLAMFAITEGVAWAVSKVVARAVPEAMARTVPEVWWWWVTMFAITGRVVWTVSCFILQRRLSGRWTICRNVSIAE
ncbi:MAG: hypothetical protein LBD60_02165 [Puniceicoccales bacterium]|jgi:hypothetical protein|nr:hypothetical protein [Puniceicoccales bacterium]